jgi:predicted HicB family RNase H-like nuclease
LEEIVEYKGYTGMYGFEDGVFHGRVAGIADIVTFEADKEENVEKEFRASVDDYLDFCSETKMSPERPDVE